MPVSPAPRGTPRKFSVPGTTAQHLHRPRLIEQIASAAGARLILIRAAAGFGKSTLLLQYHAHWTASGNAALWVNLDAGDNDLQRFVRLLREGLDSVLPTSGFADAAADDDSQDLLERIARCETPFALCFDEFESIHSADVLAFVQQLMELLPQDSVLAIASRTTPGLGLGRIRARGQLLDIKPGDLRFTLDEARSFIRDQRHIALLDDEVATLYRCTEGWIAGLYLASLSLQDRSDHGAFIASFSGSNLELAEYLTEDILARQPADSRAFLLHSSIPNQFNAALCNALTGRDDSQAMIERLERANLFILPVDNQQQWFRYHPLFASFLRDALAREDAHKPLQLHGLAAQWFIQAGQLIPAIEHLFSAGHLEQAAEQLAAHLNTLVDSGRTLLLRRWLDQIPATIRAPFPALNRTYAWILALSCRLNDALHVAEQLEHQHGPQFAYVPQVIHCLHLSASDRVEECCDLGIELLARMPADDVQLYIALAHAVTTNLFASGRYQEARELLPPSPRLSASSLSYTFELNDSILDLIQGRLRQAGSRLHNLRNEPRQHSQGKARDMRLAVDVLQALVHYENAELDLAWPLLVNALPFAKQISAADIVIVSHLLAARIAYAQGERSTWQRYLTELEQLGQQAESQRIRSSAWLERARIALHENRLDTAAQALRCAEQSGEWDRPHFLKFATDVDTPSIARQRLRIAQGEYGTASKALRSAIEEARNRRHLRRELKLSILLAMALDGLSQATEASEVLTQALRIASLEGFVQTFIDEGDALKSLLRRWLHNHQERARDQGIAEDFLARLQQWAGDSAHEQSSSSAEQSARLVLTAREYQVLQLLNAGHRNKAIAELIFLSELTVKSHLQKIYAKLEAQGRTEALAIARSKGWID